MEVNGGDGVNHVTQVNTNTGATIMTITPQQAIVLSRELGRTSRQSRAARILAEWAQARTNKPDVIKFKTRYIKTKTGSVYHLPGTRYGCYIAPCGASGDLIEAEVSPKQGWCKHCARMAFNWGPGSYVMGRPMSYGNVGVYDEDSLLARFHRDMPMAGVYRTEDFGILVVQRLDFIDDPFKLIDVIEFDESRTSARLERMSAPDFGDISASTQRAVILAR